MPCFEGRIESTYLYLRSQSLISADTWKYEGYGTPEDFQADFSMSLHQICNAKDNENLLLIDETGADLNLYPYLTVYDYVYLADSEDALQEAVVNIGPISVVYDGRSSKLQNYKSGIYYDPNCNPSSVNTGNFLFYF